MTNDKIAIAAVGDIMLGDHPVRFGNGVRSRTDKIGVQSIFSSIQGEFEGCDIVFGNLEVCHSNAGLKVGVLESEEFRGAPSAIPALRRAGFNVLGMANNHAMEHGLEAFWETKNLLEENGIFPAGVDGATSGCIPFRSETATMPTCLLSYSLRPENYFTHGRVPYSLRVDPLDAEERILDEVGSAKKQSRVVVVSLHWGEEFLDYPSASQVIFAHKLVDAGASLILGHHPHVLQGIEKYRGAVIAYSLGNFVFDMWQSPTRSSMLLKATLSESGIDFGVVPAYINSSFQPVRADGADRRRRLAALSALGEKIRHMYLDKGVDSWRAEDIERSELEYQRHARRMTRRHRVENYAFFLTHLHQYKGSVLRQSLSRFLARRAEEISAKS